MLKRQLLVGFSIILITLLLGIGCAPKTQDTPSTTKAQPTPVTTTSASKPASISAEDAAWAQVVADARKEGKVTIYTWGMAGQPGVKVAKAFKDAYGIEIEVVTGQIPSLIEKLKTEQASKMYTADTFDASASSLLIVKDAGLSQPIGNLPVLSQKSSFRGNPIVDQDGHLAYLSVNYQANLINTNLVKSGQEPKSYRELLDPKWKGKVIIPSAINAPGFNRLYALKDALGLDDDYFRRLAQNNLTIAATDKDAADMIVRGEGEVSPLILSLASASAAKGAPVKAAAAAEGTIAASGNTWSLIKNPAHPNAARVFLNWLLSAEGQKIYSEAASWTPIRKDVPDYIPAPLVVPEGAKIIFSDIATEKKVADLRQEKVLAKLMGIEK